MKPSSPSTLHQKALGVIGLQNKTCCDRSESDLKRMIELMYSLYCLTRINARFALKIFEFLESKNESAGLNCSKDFAAEASEKIAALIVTKGAIFQR